MKNYLHKLKKPGEPLLLSIFNLLVFFCSVPGARYLYKKLFKNRSPKVVIVDYNDWVIEKISDRQLTKKLASVENPAELEKIGVALICNNATPAAIQKWIIDFYNTSPIQHLIILVTDNKEVTSFIYSVDTGLKNKSTIQVVSVSEFNSGAYETELTVIVLATVQVKLDNDCFISVINSLYRGDGNWDLAYYHNGKVDNDGTFSAPNFKPSFSPHHLLNTNYIGNSFAVKVDHCKQHPIDFQGADNELLHKYALEWSIGHKTKVIDAILYHEAKTADNLKASTLKASIDYLRKKGFESDTTNKNNNLRISVPPSQPLVSIIIPTKDQAGRLKVAVESLIRLTEYKNYEIIILDNNSETPEFFALIEEWKVKQAKLIKCIEAKFPFNFSKLMNLGAANARGEYLLLLNNDVEIIEPNWLREMLGYAALPFSGAAGAKLLFEDKSIQHAGIILENTEELTGHAFINIPNEATDGAIAPFDKVMNYPAITAACLLISKEKWDFVGGMDESLPVEYNDVAFCLSLKEQGFFNVYLPDSVLIHYESATRGHPFRSLKSYQRHEKDLKIFKEKWGNYINKEMNKVSGSQLLLNEPDTNTEVVVI